MSMPGFTAELSLSELRGQYAVTQQHAFSRSGRVIGQQIGGVVPSPRRLLLKNCSDCIPSSGPLSCGVYRWDPVFGSEDFLGRVTLPDHCGWGLPPCLH
jgi:hypothetical protein